MMLTTSFSMTSAAQHYVKIVNNTTSINGTQYKSGDILPVEVDSSEACYIHIITQSTRENTRRNGVINGAKFKITDNTGNPSTVKFYDNNNELRSECYQKGEILVKVDEDYLLITDVIFLNSSDVNHSREKILNEIKATCKFDSEKQCLDFTQCPYSYIFNNNVYKGDKQYMSSNTQITFLTTTQNIPNITLCANDFKVIDESGIVKKKDNGIVLWLKDNWIIALCALLVIGLLAILAYMILNKKHQKKSEDDSEFDDNTLETNLTMKKKHQEKDNKRVKIREQHVKQEKETANPNIVESKETIFPVVDEKLHQKLADVLSRIEITQSVVSKQTATLESIRLLVSNTEDKKQLTQKIQELEAEKKKSANAIAQRDAALSDIEKLKGNIAQLQASSHIEGVLQVTEYSTFVSFAKKVVSECAEAENIAIKYWSSLNSKDQQVLNGFLSKFHMTKCSIDLAKWNGIIATLDLKGYIKNDEYITYLTPLSDKDRMVFLNKRFFEDILRPYVGAIILFLEQIRTANKIGVSAECNENIEGFINSICTRCHEQGVFVDYRKLYEKVTEYDSLEIDENIPDTIKKVISKVEEEDALLYVDKYAVNLKSGEMTEKTRCYIKI